MTILTLELSSINEDTNYKQMYEKNITKYNGYVQYIKSIYPEWIGLLIANIDFDTEIFAIICISKS